MQGKIVVDSAGTGSWNWRGTARWNAKILTENAISYEGITARQVEESDLTKFHYIIVMDANNLQDVQHSANLEVT